MLLVSESTSMVGCEEGRDEEEKSPVKGCNVHEELIFRVEEEDAEESTLIKPGDEDTEKLADM
jgi:hypothetical protein